ncbi:unnamed protein product [Discosporangium mesarthrocarpum]
MPGRVLLVPDELSTDGDARLRHVLTRIVAIHNPDFVFFCNEHTFVVPENLRCFVDRLDPVDPVYLGNVCVARAPPPLAESWIGLQVYLNSGAAGFILSRASLSLLRQGWEAIPECVALSETERQNPGRCVDER